MLSADLEVGQANGGDDAEHDAEDPPDDGRGDGDEEGAELGEEAEDHHGQGGGLDDSPRANLGEVPKHIFFQKKSASKRMRAKTNKRSAKYQKRQSIPSS